MASPFLNFSKLQICIAVDTSGSTAGTIIKKEADAALAIARLLSPQNKSTLKLLPWNNSTAGTVSLQRDEVKVDLKSGGGTRPLCLYQDPKCLAALRECGLWFLFTDGEMGDWEVKEFAITTSKLGLHGIPSVVVVFGYTSRTTPGKANISVGIATYSQAPDAIFLFQDSSSGLLYILQAKGCFKALLPTGSEQQDIGPGYTWNDLPLTTYEDFAALNIPPPQKLSEGELAFQDGLVINLDDLYNGHLSARDLSLVSQQENLSSIVTSEVSRGAGRRLQQFLGSAALTPIPAPPTERPDVLGAAKTTLTKILGEVSLNSPAHIIDSSRETLRHAHETNLGALTIRLKDHKAEVRKVRNSNQRFAAASKQAEDQSDIREATSTGNERREWATPSEVWGSSGLPIIEDDEDMDSVYDSDFEMVEASASSSNTQILNDLLLPGFHRSTLKSRERSEFFGKCSLCHRESVLAVLLKTPSEAVTKALMESQKQGPIDLPLLEIFSTSIVCDGCAHHLVDIGQSPSKESVIGAIALVAIKNNEEAWTKAVDKFLVGFCGKTALLRRFADIFDSDDNKSFLAGLTGDEMFRKAMIWMKDELSGFLGSVTRKRKASEDAKTTKGEPSSLRKKSVKRKGKGDDDAYH